MHMPPRLDRWPHDQYDHAARDTRADLMLSTAADKENAFVAFAQAVSDYFDVSNGPTRISYFTDLLIFIRDKLQLAGPANGSAP
jgi:hypothetical protein